MSRCHQGECHNEATTRVTYHREDGGVDVYSDVCSDHTPAADVEFPAPYIARSVEPIPAPEPEVEEPEAE